MTEQSATSRDEETAALVARILKEEDYFEVLSIERTASEKEVIKAYRKLALRVHPDKTKVEGAEEAFKRVSSAFACLRDADSRSHYERFGRDPSQSQVGGQQGNPFAGHMDPNDLFREMFAEMQRAQAAQGMGRGPGGMPAGFTFVGGPGMGGFGGQGQGGPFVVNGVNLREHIPPGLRPLYDVLPGNVLAMIFGLLFFFIIQQVNWPLFMLVSIGAPGQLKGPLMIGIVLGSLLGFV
ncbi:DnaJ family protein [Hondaea fermentalgiana]|uniref:DnaJ family protein n=1 Tax=Hondaea fermentalgiana TaxID=2315210 RepID=A0A2R5GJA2_9STRA|nr:DnaJ family protein [Hondaea fermentalgiana]|eukprot:GBG28371.1 DnaJ family protein [Hondaea fermentalgiana]